MGIVFVSYALYVLKGISMLNSSSELKEEMLSFVSAEAQYYHDIK
jgi:hypothetical protein